VFPNQREAEALVGNEFQTDEDFQHALSAIASMGAGGVVVTLKTGCYALLPAGKGKRQMYRAWIPRIEAVSSVGSGDAFLAGFLSAHEAGHPAAQCLRMGLACGAANTQAMGAGVFDPRDVSRYSGLVEVQEIAGFARAS
jgi:1-phosphofructokinase